MTESYRRLGQTLCRVLACALSVSAHAGIFDGELPRGACRDNVFVRKAEMYNIAVQSPVALRTLQGSFFGFNIEWLEFQLGFWDETRGQVQESLVSALQPFAGAIYRYPGGGIANHTDWRDGDGSRAQRLKRVREGWTPPMALDFGVDEYLDFVAAVRGNAWYVANLYGRESGELPSSTVAAQAQALASRLVERRAAGKPAILRWELGNELDRGQIRWPPEKLASVANETAEAIRRADPQAKFVILQQEYPTLYKQGVSRSSYNRSVAKATLGTTHEYAAHIYYDDGTADAQFPKKLSAMCAAIEDARTARQDLKVTPFWITETARVPAGIYEPDAKRVWTQTGNLQSAISIADLYISAAQVPEVQGAFLHALHGTDGPWALFHLSRDKARLHPSVALLAARMLRESMLPVVLKTQTSSRNQGDYEGGYDLHGTVMTDVLRQRYSLWAVNRSNGDVITRLDIPALRGLTVSATVTVLSDEQLAANNVASAERLQPKSTGQVLTFDANGGTSLRIPLHSVYTLLLQTPSFRTGG